MMTGDPLEDILLDLMSQRESWKSNEKFHGVDSGVKSTSAEIQHVPCVGVFDLEDPPRMMSFSCSRNVSLKNKNKAKFALTLGAVFPGSRIDEARHALCEALDGLEMAEIHRLSPKKDEDAKPYEEAVRDVFSHIQETHGFFHRFNFYIQYGLTLEVASYTFVSPSVASTMLSTVGGASDKWLALSAEISECIREEAIKAKAKSG